MEQKDTVSLLGSIICRGDVIFIKCHSISEPIPCMIEELDDKHLYFRMPDVFIEKNILEGDALSCQTIYKDTEYIMSGEIVDIDIRFPRIVQFRADKMIKFKNNRVFRRYSVKLQASVYEQGRDCDMYAIVKNISIHGVALVMKEKLEDGTIVEVKIPTTIKGEDILEFKAKVVRIAPEESHYEYGLEVIEIDKKSSDFMDRLIFNLTNSEESYIDALKKGKAD